MSIRYYDTVVYRMGDMYKTVYKIKHINDELKPYYDDEDKRIKEIEPDIKRMNNIIRAKNTVIELGLCNDWDWFCTFTLDPKKYDRTNLKAFKKDFTQWIRNQRKTGGEWKYVLIPELHKDDKCWHLHGLLKGVNDVRLRNFTRELGHPIKLVRGQYKYDPVIGEKFGFNSFGKIRSKNGSAYYCSKYFTKALRSSKCELGSHLLFASQGLKRKEIVGTGHTVWSEPGTRWNEYCGIKWSDESNAEKIIGNLL